MSQIFFDELDIPRPEHELAISASSHGSMTGRMLEEIETLLIEEKPDGVLIYGDTNSTLAGALAAAKLHIPVFHVEAGLRSFNMKMPEEINRILSDRVSRLLFCPTDTAVQNLANEGVSNGVSNIGDVMYDVALYYRERALAKSTVIDDLGLTSKAFVLATCHRAENTDSEHRLTEIMKGLATIADRLPVVLPLHPRTRKLIDKFGLSQLLGEILVLDPVSYLDMVALEQGASTIITDSGGVQKEAFFYDVPCITMRDETEWSETVELGWNYLAGADSYRIVEAFAAAQSASLKKPAQNPYGDGHAATKIVEEIVNYLNRN